MERDPSPTCRSNNARSLVSREDACTESSALVAMRAAVEVPRPVNARHAAVGEPSRNLLANIAVAVVGLGHVGLQVAMAMSARFPTVGFDNDETRVATLRNGIDCSGEIALDALSRSRLKLHIDPTALADSNFFIVTVPTPLTPGGKPDFSLLERACSVVGDVMQPGSTVVFESTVYPGATEEICGPALERASGLQCGVDFHIAYSPERINPGDTDHGFASVVKLVSAQDAKTLERVAAVYATVVDAGVFRASSIKVAEAAKVLESTQRDVNIALVNEMAKICGLLGVRTHDVLRAAGSKWNFLPFAPGLAGGHCVGVDPCYLADKAQRLGYQPEVILAARRVNDSMPSYVASRIVLKMAEREQRVRGARVGILGVTFKEDVPDLRDSRTVELIEALAIYGIKAHIADPHADLYESRSEYGMELEDEADWRDLNVLVLAVPHREFLARIHEQIDQSLRPGGVFVDLKARVPPATLQEDVCYLSL